MAKIHLFGGEKGGVGKSFVCRAAVAYLLKQEMDFALFDADRSGADVLRMYGEVTGGRAAILSEAEKYDNAANAIFNSALAGQRVLVNLPTHSMAALEQWIDDNELLEIAADGDVEFVSWFVSDGGMESLASFSDLLDVWGESMRHVFVANYGRSQRWDELKQNAELMGRMKQLGVTLVKFPKFVGRTDRDRVDKLSLTFERAIEHEAFDAIGKQRVRSFLRKSAEEFERSGVFK